MSERLVQFLYKLLCDYLPAVAVESAARHARDLSEIRTVAPGHEPPRYVYAFPHVEAHARDLARRLVPSDRCRVTWQPGARPYQYECDLDRGHAGQHSDGGVPLSDMYRCGARLVRGTAAFVCGLRPGHVSSADPDGIHWHEDATGVAVRWKG